MVSGAVIQLSQRYTSRLNLVIVEIEALTGVLAFPHSRNPQHRALLQDWQDFSDSSSPHPRDGVFSMTQAAKNTERHAMSWGQTRFREQGIRFVSAGNLVQEDIEAVANEEEAQEDHDISLEQVIPQHDTEEQVQRDREVSPVQATRQQDTENIEEKGIQSTVQHDVVVEDVTPQPWARKDSVSSHSSEEIIFSGRQRPAGKPDATKTSLVPKPTPLSEAEPPETSPLPKSPVATVDVTPQDSASSELDKFSKILPPRQSRVVGRRGRRGMRSKVARNRDDDEAIMNDYIANLAFDDDSDEDGDGGSGDVTVTKRTEHFRLFDGTTEQYAKVQTKSQHDVPHEFVQAIQAGDWDSADLEDFDDISTTDEEIGEVAQVLRQRSRPSGEQYLVTAVGKDTSDACWVPLAKLTSSSAAEKIRAFEQIREARILETTGDSDEDSESDEALEDLIDDIESEDDENARILKHTARMTDEQIARALAKQEELGLGGDELLLFDGQVGDGDDIDEDDEDDDDFARGDGFIPFSSKTHLSSRTKSRRNRRQHQSFPPAEAFADALEQDPYGAFDVMDFDRPSLRPKKKGRKSDFPFDLGPVDEELAEQLRSTWSKDREKKAARKREKMEVREAALLEASERSHPAAIKAEIQQFLIQEADTLELAPMDSSTRAAVHRLAKALRLKSHSEGKEGQGLGRHPVLTKGPNTPRYTIDTVWEIDALMNTRKFFPKHGTGSYKSSGAARALPGAARARRGGGGMASGATYMNGEVVGASAPEIGSDNKGRAMLEKMGWTSGMGIGAVGNKGGLEAIKHVVRTTKAGLG